MDPVGPVRTATLRKAAQQGLLPLDGGRWLERLEERSGWLHEGEAIEWTWKDEF